MQRDFSPKNVAELMDSVIDIYKKSFGKQIAFAAIVQAILIAGVFALTFAFVFLFFIFSIDALTGNSSVGGAVFIIVGVAMIAILPAVLVWQAFASSGHILLSQQAFYGHRVRFEFKKIFKVVICVITTFLAQVILVLPFIVVAMGVIYFFSEVFSEMFRDFFVLNSIPVGGIIGIFAAIFIAGVGIFIYTNIFSLSVAVAVFERRHFFGAIARSWELVKPEFWRICGIRLIWTFVAFAFSFSAQMISALALPALGLLADFVPVAVFGIISLFVMFISNVAIPIVITLLAAPLDGIMPALIYFNRRIKAEGLDLEIRLEKLQVNQ